jgi:hypothetical protein
MLGTFTYLKACNVASLLVASGIDVGLSLGIAELSESHLMSRKWYAW